MFFIVDCITGISHSTLSLSNISERFISSLIFLIVGVFLIYRNFSYIEDISCLLRIFNLQNLWSPMFDGCNNLLAFSDINCPYFKFCFCLFYYSGMWADLWVSLYTCLLCLLKPTSVIMGKDRLFCQELTGVLFSEVRGSPAFLEGKE